MKFPVDLLADVSQTEMERLANDYMNNLLYSNPDSPEHLTLSDSTQVTIDISTVGFLPLYGSSDKHKILALFCASEPFTAVALYLLDRWWTVDDILKTADPARDGAVEVETVGERIVLYILNRVIYRAKEMSSEELPFLCHGEVDHAKVQWNNGEAVGFYSVKPSGSFCNYFSTRSFQLPVMDSIFVRKCQRGKGFGLQMLEDFVLSFKEDCLGLRYPLTKSMYKVCEKYLCQYPGDTDLLWEVESIGGPNQRINIARKIQAMDQRAVSKNQSFTEESLVITEITEEDVVMEAITTQIKEAQTMECTVEIVEEMTVLNAIEADVPLTARGRSSGSKQRKMAKTIAEDKSEKVIRIEDIEAETPGEEHVSALQKTSLPNVSELVPDEGMFGVGQEKQGEDVVDTASEEAAAMVDQPSSVLEPQDLEEADVTSAPMTEETQVEDDVPQDLNNTSDDSQITVENVASQIEEECEKEDTAVSVVPEEVLDVHKEAETLDKVGEQTPKIGVTDEISAESFTQHEVRISTPATSENGEPGKSRRAVVRAITAVQSETPRRRSKRHSKLEEGIQEETKTQDGGRTLRRRTVMNTPTPKRKYTRHQKVFEEGENKAEVSEENEVLKTEVVEESAVTEGEEQEEMTTMKEDVVLVEELTEEKQHLEDEQLTDEEKTEKQQGLGLEDTVVKGSSTELPGTAETALTEGDEDEIVIDESEKEQQGDRIQTSVIQDKQDTSDDEVEEPPVVEKRALRGRRKVTPKPKPTKQSKRHQKQAGEHTDEAEEKADEQATDKQMEEHHQVEQEKTVDKTEEEISTDKLIVVEEGALPKTEEAAEDVIPSTEVNMAESREVQEEEGTDGETETVSVIEAEKKKETVSVTGVADDIIQVPDTAASAAATATAAAAAASAAFAASALETEISDSVLSEAVVPATEEPQEKYIGSEIPNLQKATVILVDIKTTCHHLSVKEAEETQVDGESDAPKKQQEEEDGGKGQNTTEKSLAATETVEKEELEEDNSEKEKDESASVEISGAEHCTSTRSQQEEEDNLGEGVTDKEADEAETGADEVEGERESVAKDAVTVTVPAEQSAISEICADREADIPVGEEVEKDLPPAVVDEGMGFEEEETPVVETKSLGRRTKKSMATPTCKSTRSRNQVGAQGAENSEDEPIVTTRTLRRGRISASDTPEGKSRRSRKQIQEEQKGEAESATGVEEEEVAKEAAVVKTDKEMDEKVEEEASESTAILRPSAEEAPPLAEEQQSKDMASQISDLQRVTVLVDMQTTHHDVQEEAAAAEEVSVQKTAAGAENEQREEAMKEEETVGHENVLRSPVAIETTELVEDKGFEDTVKTVRIKDTVEGRAEETAKEDEAESMNDEEQESTVTETRTLRSRKQAVKATPTTKLARSRQSDKSEVEKEAASKVQKEEPAIQERDTTDQAENIEAEMGIEKMDTVAEEPAIQQDAPEEGQDDNTETVADEDTESSAGQHAVEGNTLDAAEEAVTGEGEQCTSSSKVAESAVEQGAQVTLLTARDDEAKCASEEEEAQVMERVLRSDEKTVRATTRSKATKRQDDEQEEETIGEKGTEEDETAVGPRVLRKGRRSAAATPRRKSKRVRTQCPSEEEEETTPSEEKELEGAHTKKKDINSDEKIGEKDGEGAAAQEEETVPEEIQEEETKAVLGETEEKEESNNEKIEEKDGEEAAVHEEETTEPEVEMAKVEAVAEGSIAEQEIAQEEQSAVSETRSDAQGETSAGEMAEETPNADMGKVTEEEPPTVVSGPLRSGTKRRRATTRSKTTRRKEDEQEEETTGEESTEEYEPAVEPRVLRKGRRSAAATPRRKSKRVRTQCPSEEEEETAPPEEKHVEEEGKESPEEKGEELEEERRSIKLEKEKKSIELEKDKYVEEEEVESRARGGSPVVEAEQTQDASTEEAAALEEEGNSVEAVDEIGTELLKISSAEAEETKSAEEEETTVKEKSAATEMGSDTAIADKEALAEDASAVACEEAPAVTRALRGKTKSSHATLSRRSRRRKDQGVLETQQQEDEKLEEEEVHQLTTDSPRRSIRKRQRVDYRENDKEDERAETDAATDEEGEEKLESDEKKDKIAECSADKPIEKVDIFNLVLDTDEEVEPAGKSQEEEDNEQNMSEEEVEPLVIGKRDLRGRSVPSVVITPRSESRRRSATVHKTEESMSDREKSHRSAQKRKGTEATVTRKSKRLSRV